MPDSTITIDSAAVSALLASGPGRIEHAIRGSLEDSRSYFLATMKHYPPIRPGQAYIRTGTLMRSWSGNPITATSSGWQVVVGSNSNMAPYNRRVQSRAEQGPYFRGRWLTAESAVEQSASQIQRFVDARVRAALGGA